MLNIYDIMFADNVPAYIATRKRVLKKLTSNSPGGITGARSAACDCIVVDVNDL